MRRLAWLALFALAGLLGAGGWLLGTSFGLRVLAAQLEARGWLTAEAVEGRLLDRLTLGRATLRLPGLALELEHFTLDWQPGALLRGRLHVRELACAGVRVSVPDDSTTSWSGWAPPLAVQVDRLRIEDLALREGGEATPLLHRLEATARLAGGRLQIERLALDTPWGTLDGAGAWGLGPDEPGEFELRWTARLAGLKAPLAGKGRLAGTLRRLAVQQQLQQPLAARLVAEVEPLTDGLPWQAVLDADALAPDTLLEGLPGLGAWRVRLEAAGAGRGAEIKTLEAQQGRRRLHGAGRLDWARGAEGPLGTSGRSGAHAAKGLRGEARLDWQNLAWPLVGAARLESPRGTLAWQGTPTAYRFEGEARLAAPGQPAAELALHGQGGLEHVAFESLSLRALEGELAGRGTVHWATGLHWQGELAARDLRPEVLLPAWPGRLSAAVRSQGTLRAGRINARLEIERLRGVLRGHPVEARLRGQIDGARGLLEQFELRSGRSRVEAQGSLGETLDLALAVEAPELGALLPGAAGSLRGQARLTGTPRAPRLEGAFTGQRLGWQDWRIASLSLRGAGGPDPKAALAMELEADGVSHAGRLRLGTARLTLAGLPAAHDLRLELMGAGGAELRLAGTGRWDGGQERLRLAEGQASRTPLGDWRSIAPVDLVAGPRAFELPRWCWGQDPARLCLEGRWAAGQQGAARLELAGLDLARLDPWLARRGWRLSGRLAGEAVLEAPKAGAPTLAARLAVERAAIHLPGRRRGTWLDVPLEQARLAAQLGGGSSRLAAVLRKDEANRLEAHIALPGHRLEDGLPPAQRLDGVVELHYREPLMLTALLPTLREPRGVLAGRLLLAGTLGQPSLYGGAQVLEAGVVVPELGIRMEEGALIVRAGPGPYLGVEGGARLGRGRLGVTGRIELAGLPDWRAEFELAGEDLTALRLPEASVQASPALKIALRPGVTRISGRVVVPEALFDLGGETPAAARTSPDVRVLGEADAPRPHALDTRVELVLGEQVRVRGKGFSGRVTGHLTVTDRPGLPGPLGQGELTIVDGRYRAYGQDLAIEQGRLIFTDTPLDDPALDLRAVRRGVVDGTIAGVRITGRASQPELTLFSIPAKEQAEVLAYLVTGRPLKQGSGGDAALMIQAARAAGFAGGDLLAAQIGSAFGLEEATIENHAGTRELSLVLGRYLTPRLYLRYAHGLEAGLQAIILRYELTRHLHVQVQSGVKAGVDVFYSIER